ncbi:MAG TPA: hypothetical protein ENF40_01320 [Thermoplasmatales archaeon]|nr:hypothetical protein [Thermoplasmatales archaeon]
MAKAEKDVLAKAGAWAFLIGIVVAVVVGIFWERWIEGSSAAAYISGFLAVLGLIVGIIAFFGLGTITREEIPNFLIAALVIVGIGATATLFGMVPLIGWLFEGVATTLAVFIAPAAGLLAIRAIWDIGKD